MTTRCRGSGSGTVRGSLNKKNVPSDRPSVVRPTHKSRRGGEPIFHLLTITKCVLGDVRGVSTCYPGRLVLLFKTPSRYRHPGIAKCADQRTLSTTLRSLMGTHAAIRNKGWGCRTFG